MSEAPEAAVAILRKEALVRTISRDGNFIVMHFAGGTTDEAALLKKLIESNIKVYSFSRGQSSLENPVSYTHLDVYKRQGCSCIQDTE